MPDWVSLRGKRRYAVHIDRGDGVALCGEQRGENTANAVPSDVERRGYCGICARKQTEKSKVALRVKRVEFLRLALPLTTYNVVAELFQISHNTVNSWCSKYNLPGRSKKDQRPVSLHAMRLLWNHYEKYGKLPPRLTLDSDDELDRLPSASRKKDTWTSGELNYLRDNWGRCHNSTLARRLKRTKRSIWLKAKELKLPRYTQKGLARMFWEQPRRVKVSNVTIYSWCAKGLLRCWMEGSWKFIHADDAEWLLENYKWRERFPQYPGMTDDERAAYCKQAKAA